MAEITVTDESGTEYTVDKDDLTEKITEPHMLVESSAGVYGFKIPLSKSDQFSLFFDSSGRIDHAVRNTEVDVSEMKNCGATYARSDEANLDGYAAVRRYEIIEP
jgi:hypothetical protein